jgi:hypothetical protein
MAEDLQRRRAEDLQRERAKFAAEKIDGWLKLRSDSLYELPRLPILIRTQGLLIAYCMLRSGKGMDAAQAIEAWLTRLAPNPPLRDDSGGLGFVQLCTNAERSRYLAAEREAIAFAQILKRMADALAPAGGR